MVNGDVYFAAGKNRCAVLQLFSICVPFNLGCVNICVRLYRTLQNAIVVVITLFHTLLSAQQ